MQSLLPPINTWPGRSNLKALGGTFLPSFQDAQRQDRYGWVDMGLLTAYDATNGIVSIGTDLPLTLPENGWIRVSNGTESLYGYYSHYDFKNPQLVQPEEVSYLVQTFPMVALC